MSDDQDAMDTEQDEPVLPSSSSSPSMVSGAFPASNGVDHGMENGNGDSSPVPPPHRVPAEPPAPPRPTIDAEACKAAGNKFFKMGDYDKAIREYSKGVLTKGESYKSAWECSTDSSFSNRS